MDAVDEVKGRLNIEDVIGEYLTLKRSGRNFKAISPFTNEKTPSFIVSPEKQIWKDFSSGKGGSLFDFVMEVEGLDFKGALELLARKAGVDLEQYQPRSARKGPNKEKLYALLELSTKFYQVQFSKNKLALDYVLNKRGFSKATALTWQLGYSPNTGSALLTWLKSKGHSEAEIKQAGLLSQTYRGGLQDMFRGRLMIPLSDPSGRIIGFTARLLIEDDNAPKYINTAQTVLYDKSRHVYGLHQAKQAIRKNNFVVMAEGNLDVIASHQAGVKQTVATAGTALTEMQLKALSRLSTDIRLCFDSDRAGLAATERAIPIASKVKVSLSMIAMPSGKDPDELIRQDAAAWRAVINKPIYALDWLMQRQAKLLDIKSAPGKRQFSDILLPVIKGLSDSVEQDHYLNLLATTLDISRNALTDKFSKTPAVNSQQTKKVIKTHADIDSQLQEALLSQDRFLSLMLARPELRQFMDLVKPEMLTTNEAKELLNSIKAEPKLTAAAALKQPKLADYVKIEVLLYEELYQDIELSELSEEAARLQANLVTKFVKTEKTKLVKDVANAGSASALRSLQEKDRHFNALLNQVKGAAHG